MDDSSHTSTAECDYDVRNVLSWRVPNSPSLRSPSEIIRVDEQKVKSLRTKPKKSLSSNSLTIQENQDSLSKVPREEGVISLKHNFGNKLWRILFANVNRSVDELYSHCEEQEDEQKCRDAIDLMERSSRDFQKLIERIEEQKRFDSKGQLSGGISWEVRKPTNTPPKSTNVIIHLDPGTSAESISHGGSLKAAAVVDSETRVSSLRATAQPFQPSAQKADSQKISSIMNISEENLADKTRGKEVIGVEAQLSKLKSLDSKRAGSTRSGSSVGSNKSINSNSKPMKAPQKSSAKGSLNSPLDKWDEGIHSEVTAASEQVWAEAEAWVDAEAAAEENEWRILGFGAGRSSRLTARSLDSSLPAASGLDSKRLSRSLDALDAAASQLTGKEPQPDLQRSTDNSSVSYLHSNKSRDKTIFGESIVGGPALRLEISDSGIAEVPLIIETLDSHDPHSSRRTSPLLLKFSPSTAAGGSRKTFLSNSPISGGSALLGTPSPNSAYNYASSVGTSGGRSLHDKLSSPDRKRDLSPTEALRIHEARQIAAETNRDKSMAEKVQKAMIASTRVKLRGEKEAQRLLLKEQALEEKLKDAEIRHTKHIKEIKGKAGNENSKVSEVIFINSLNSEGIAEQLQQKLEEVEARILAANERRQQRLNGIGNRERKKNTKKANQMCELRLALERQKMERWEKLQKRLEKVQQRRAARLEEIQRRCDEAATLHGSETSSVLGTRTPSAVDSQLAVAAEELARAISDSEIASGTGGTQPDNKSGGVLLLLKPKSKSKAKKAKSRKSKKLNFVSEDPDDGGSDRDASTVIASFPEHFLEEAFKSLQNTLNKKQLKTARDSCVQAARSLPAASTNRFVGDSRATLSSWGNNFRARKNSPSGADMQILQSLVDSVVVILSLNDNLSLPEVLLSRKNESTSVGQVGSPSLRSDLSIVLQSVISTTDDRFVEAFVDSGGLFLLRAMVGPEAGLLSDSSSFVHLSQGGEASEVILVSVFHALEKCCSVSSGVVAALEGGLFLLLSDILLALMTAKESFRKCKAPSGSSSSLLFDRGSGLRQDQGQTNDGNFHGEDDAKICAEYDSAQLYNDFDKYINRERSTIVHTNTVDWIIPSLLFSLSQLFTFGKNHFGLLKELDSSYLDYVDSLLWYSFAVSHLGNLVHCLRMMESDSGQLAASKDQDICHFNPLIFSSSIFIASCCRYLSFTSPQVLIQSVNQLSNRSLRHSKGKLIASLVRKSEVTAVLLDVLHRLCDFDSLSFSGSKVRYSDRGRGAEGFKGEQTRESSLAVFFSISAAWTHLAAIDISIVQQFTSEQEAVINRTFDCVITATIAYIKTVQGLVKKAPAGEEKERDLFQFFSLQRKLQKEACLISSALKAGSTISIMDAESGLAEIIRAVGLSALRCPSLQKSCGMTYLMGSLRPYSPLGIAVLQSICKLSTKYYKDRRFKQSLLPALISLSLDVDANIHLVKVENKLSYIVKYLEQHLRTIENGTENEDMTNNILSVQLSHALPVDLWSISLITYGS